MTLLIGDSGILRVKSLLYWCGLVSTSMVAHSNLLHFGERINDSIVLVCFILVGLNQPVASKMEKRTS